MTIPLPLGANQPANRFYRGGEKIRQFRGDAAGAAAGDRVPEDWVASTTTLFGEPSRGMSILPGTFPPHVARSLRQAVAANPQAWLGPQHVAAFGADSKLLVKLLDAGQRLPVHVHPHGDFARSHLGASHGKAEAWFILSPGTVWLGFSREVGDELAGLVAGQDVDALLGALHTIEVQAGDTVYVPPGLPHAIGAGIFLIEVQEPTDLSILLEWKDFALDGETDGHLGIGFPTALTATDTRAWSQAQVEELVVRAGATGEAGSILSPAAAKYFRLERLEIDGVITVEGGYGVLVVIDGDGALLTRAAVSAHPRELPLSRGDTVVVPHAAGTLTLRGRLTVLRCRPPVAPPIF